MTTSQNPIQVLHIEDNPADVAIIQNTLQKVGSPFFEVKDVNCLRKSYELLAKSRFDLILLDLSLPDAKGLQAFRKLREQVKDIPIVVLTGLTDEGMAIEAVQAGAQDYFMKEEVRSNHFVRSLIYAMERFSQQSRIVEERLRSHEVAKKAQTIFRFGSLILNTVTQTGTVGLNSENELLRLTHMEFKVLFALAQSEGQILSREQLVEKAWTHRCERPSTRSVDRHITTLRKKSPILERHIESIYGAGYRFSSKGLNSDLKTATAL